MTGGFARRHVGSLTAVLSTVSLGVIVAAVRGVVPSSALPHAPDALLTAIPTLNAAISLVAIAVILSGLRWIRRGDVGKHRAAMLSAAGLFALFLALYLYRIVVEGTTQFPGPDAVYTFVYLPILVVHMGLAVVCVPLLYYVLLLAATRPVGEIPRTNHARVARVAAPLWLVSFALGVVVYVLLYVVY